MVKSQLVEKLCNMHPNALRKDLEKLVDIIIYEMQTFGDISSLKENTHNTLLETYSKIESDWDIDHKKIDSSNRMDIAYSELKDDPKKIIKNISEIFYFIFLNQAC